MKNILFTSDLDRTLIFSQRTKLADAEYVCIEQLEGQDLSYMSKATYTQLENLLPIVEFVPVTTRSRAQYERITVFQQQLCPQYAVMSNGGVILKNGAVDENWQQYITQSMARLPLAHIEVPTKFQNVFQAPFTLRMHVVEQLFYVLIVERQELTQDLFIAIRTALEKYAWTCYLQGKKLYILPRFLTKGAAVQYIKGLQHYEWHAAAGDSAMDVSMLKLAEKCFIPQHAELALDRSHQLPIMPQESSAFSEACLQYILNCSQQ